MCKAAVSRNNEVCEDAVRRVGAAAKQPDSRAAIQAATDRGVAACRSAYSGDSDVCEKAVLAAQEDANAAASRTAPLDAAACYALQASRDADGPVLGGCVNTATADVVEGAPRGFDLTAGHEVQDDPQAEPAPTSADLSPAFDTLPGLVADSTSDPRAPLFLTLAGAPIATGTVLQDDGRPAAGDVALYLDPNSNSLSGSVESMPLIGTTTLDASGAYQLVTKVTPEIAQVAASNHGYVSVLVSVVASGYSSIKWETYKYTAVGQNLIWVSSGAQDPVLRLSPQNPGVDLAGVDNGPIDQATTPPSSTPARAASGPAPTGPIRNDSTYGCGYATDGSYSKNTGDPLGTSESKSPAILGQVRSVKGLTSTLTYGREASTGTTFDVAYGAGKSGFAVDHNSHYTTTNTLGTAMGGSAANGDKFYVKAFAVTRRFHLTGLRCASENPTAKAKRFNRIVRVDPDSYLNRSDNEGRPLPEGLDGKCPRADLTRTRKIQVLPGGSGGFFSRSSSNAKTYLSGTTVSFPGGSYTSNALSGYSRNISQTWSANGDVTKSKTVYVCVSNGNIAVPSTTSGAIVYVDG
jgi:hypothetical protein